MLEYTVLFVAGLFVGWNLPQPTWAKLIQEKISNWFRSSAG